MKIVVLRRGPQTAPVCKMGSWHLSTQRASVPWARWFLRFPPTEEVSTVLNLRRPQSVGKTTFASGQAGFPVNALSSGLLSTVVLLQLRCSQPACSVASSASTASVLHLRGSPSHPQLEPLWKRALAGVGWGPMGGARAALGTSPDASQRLAQ